MIGLVLLYFIGKYFYDLAVRHHQNGWTFAILGVIGYYVIQFIGATLFTIIYIFVTGDTELYNLDIQILNLIGILMGIVGTIGLYYGLEKYFNRKLTSEEKDILDEEFLG